MENVKIGLICVGLEGERNDIAEENWKKAGAKLREAGLNVIDLQNGVTRTREEVCTGIQRCADADTVVFLIGTWILANHIVDAVAELKVPFVIWGMPEPVSFSSVGANVIHGTLDEMGIPHKMIYGMSEDARTIAEVVSFAQAAHARKKLKSARLGLIGGRAISAYPTAADPNQIKALFGTEVEHIDQLVLLEKARAVPAEVCRKKAEEIARRFHVTEVLHPALEKQMRIYFALKEMIREYDLNMLSVKCIGEFMNTYASCCVALSLLNDEGFVAGCQCNINAMISSYILHSFTEEPCFFGDVGTVDIDQGVARVINCGSIPTRLAGGDEKVEIVEQYEYMGTGRGACTLFCMKPGIVTFGTLGRRSGGEYVINIARGEAFSEPLETLRQVRSWGQGFIRLEGDAQTFWKNLRSNHSVLCYGDVVDALMDFCQLCGIDVESC